MTQKKFGLWILWGVLLALTIAAGTLSYDSCFSPLALLRNSVKVGQPYADVRRSAEVFYEAHKSGHDAQLDFGPTKWHLEKGDIPEAESISLYYQGMFDDLQLQVLFDDSGRASEVIFIGD